VQQACFMYQLFQFYLVI